MPDIAFTADSMAACAKAGHAWRWVQTWGHVGFRECATCGESGPIGAYATVGEGAPNASIEVAKPDTAPEEIAPEEPAAEELIPAVESIRDSIPAAPPAPPRPRRHRAPGSKPSGPQRTLAMDLRDAEIVRLASEGVSVAKIMKWCEISRSRVYAILEAHKAKETAE